MPDDDVVVKPAEGEVAPDPNDAGGALAVAPVKAGADSEQQQAKNDKEGGVGDDEAELSPIEAAIAVARKADLTQLAYSLGLDVEEVSTVAELEAAIEETRANQREAATDREIGDRYRTLLADIDAELDKLVIVGADESADLKLSPAQRQAVLNKVNGFRSQARTLLEVENNESLAAHVISMFPTEEAAQRFVDAAGGRDMATWQQEVVEHLAPYSRWARAQALETEKAVAKARAEGFDLGKKAPAGQASQGNGNGFQPLTSAGKTAAEIADDLRAGRLDFAAEAKRLQLAG